MDCGSGGDRQEKMQVYRGDNIENANEPMEENVPKILSREIRDVFHIFELEAHKENGSVVFQPPLSDVYLYWNVNLRTVRIANLEASDVTTFHSYMKDNGVSRIHTLVVGENADWDPIFAIIKDFAVKSLTFGGRLGTDVLHSIVKLNLEKIFYYGPVAVDFILEMDYPVQEITFPLINRISYEALMEIVQKIQSGSLRQLNVHFTSVNYRDFIMLPHDDEGPLPVNRPLLFKEGRGRINLVHVTVFWLLDRNGGITKFVSSIVNYLEIFKCEPWDVPWILRKDEDILKNLAEKHPRVYCSANHFRMFSASFIAIHRNSGNRLLPQRRPLCCKVSDNRLWLLDEKNILMRCTWEDGVATWKSVNLSDRNYKELERTAFAKYVFWALVEKVNWDDQADIYCEGLEEFDHWFDDVKKLDFDYSGPLPHERPLMFWKSARSRVVLLEDRLVECQFFKNIVTVEKCKYFNRPHILFTAESVVEMLNDPYHRGERNFNITCEEFVDAFKMFRRSPSTIRNRLLIWEQATCSDGRPKEEYWYMIDRLVRKVTWKEGRVILKEENDLCDSPHTFVKQVFRFFVFCENESINFKCSLLPFTLELEQFRSCLGQFTVLPFDYSGSLISDSPMAFVKNEIRHAFHKNGTCQCSDFFILVWFLWNGNQVTNCSWGKIRPKEVAFRGWTNEMPPAFEKAGLRMRT